MNDRAHELMELAKAKKRRKLLNYTQKPDAIANRMCQEINFSKGDVPIYPIVDDSPEIYGADGLRP